MKQLLLTVNVITYNHAQWVAECLDSILMQKTDFDFIIRIFDDCSTDGTTEICRDYEKKYPNKIQLFASEKNLGPKLNPMRSYLDIKTPFYLYIEGDDYRKNEEGFQNQINFLQKHPECSFCAAKTINLCNGFFRDSHPFLKTGVYSSDEIKKNYTRYYHSNLGTRIVRTECIHLDNSPEDYLWDVSQLYELIDMGKMGFIAEEYMVYRMTTSGCYAGSGPMQKISYLTTRAGEYNSRKNKYVLNMLCQFKVELEGEISREEERTLSQLQKNISCIIKIAKRFVHLFVPGIFSVLVHCIRDLIRIIKRRCK